MQGKTMIPHRGRSKNTANNIDKNLDDCLLKTQLFPLVGLPLGLRQINYSTGGMTNDEPTVFEICLLPLWTETIQVHFLAFGE